MIAEAPTTTVQQIPEPDGFFRRCPPRMADWTPEQRSRAAKEGWRTRRHLATPEGMRATRLAHLLRHGDPRILRLVACDLAEGALPHWQAVYPGDVRLAALIQVARRYAEGDADDYERLAASRLGVAVCRSDWPHDFSEPRGRRHPAYSAVNAAGFILGAPAGFALEWASFWAAEAHEHGSGHSQATKDATLAAIEARLAAQTGQEG